MTTDGPDPREIMASVEIHTKNDVPFAQLTELSKEQLDEEISFLNISCANCHRDARGVERRDESDDPIVYLLIIGRSYVESHFCTAAVDG